MITTLQNEKIDQLKPIYINAFETQSLNYPFHYHSYEFELTLVLGGHGLRFVGDNISRFGTCDLVLLGPGVPHSWMYNNGDNSVSDHSIQIITMHFNRHIIGEELLSRSEFSPINKLFLLAERGILFDHEISSIISEKILQLKLELDFDTFLSILDIFNELAIREDYQLLSSSDYNFRGKIDEANKFESVFKHIQSKFLTKIKISEVASIVNMNDSAFSHYFKKRTHYSFTDFINILRLNHASQLILTQHKNIAEICFESGFNNLSNFNRMFKKWTGITPLQFRKKQRIKAVDDS
jgi:AraC-like DNA-binding protein